jgi:hypothetical protein
MRATFQAHDERLNGGIQKSFSFAGEASDTTDRLGGLPPAQTTCESFHASKTIL